MAGKRICAGIGALVGMFLLILDSATAVAGAKNGLELCLRTVIPSLFPFFLLSQVLLGAFSGTPMPLLWPLAKCCGIPEGMESIFLPAFLGGYPVGAQCVAQAYQDGNLSRQDARHMLSFCNNAGPSFLFGMVGAVFSRRSAPWLLWGIHIGSALLWGYLTAPKGPGKSTPSVAQAVPLPQALQSAIRVMGTVCGWVVVFRILIAFCQKWFFRAFSGEIQVVFMGLLELSNGCCALPGIPEEEIRFLICSGILALGGGCVLLQTMSVVADLGIQSYLVGKLMQAVFSITFSTGLLYGFWWCIPLFLAVVILLKKAVAFRKYLRYNETISTRRDHYAVSEKDGEVLCLLPLWHPVGRRKYSVHQKGITDPGR